MTPTRILPDLQCSLLCEEVRQEANGNFFLVGVIDFVRVPQLPITAFKLSVFNRWTAGVGMFTESVRLIAPDQTTVLLPRLAHYGVELTEEGRSVALVTDAGTPGISDPGSVLVREAREAGVTVVPVPGPSALTAALSAAGLPDTPFMFHGFLPQRAGERRRTLESLRAVRCVLVFYEAPHRIRATLADLAATLGAGRRVVIARELTKLFETIHACTLGEAVAWIAADEHRARGEFVLVVEGAPDAKKDDGEGRRVLEALLAELPVRQAVALAVRITGAQRNELYALALEMKKGT